MNRDFAVLKSAMAGYSAIGSTIVKKTADAPDIKTLREQYRKKAVTGLHTHVPAPAKWLAEAEKLIKNAASAGVSFTIQESRLTKDGRLQFHYLLALLEPYANGAATTVIKQKTKKLKSVIAGSQTWKMAETGNWIESKSSGIKVTGDKPSTEFLKEWGLTTQPESKVIRQLLATFERAADESMYLVLIQPIKNYFRDMDTKSLGPRDQKILKRAKDRDWLSGITVALKKRKGTANLTPAQRARLRLPEVKNELLDQMMNTLEAQLRDQVEKGKMLDTDIIKIAGKSFIVSDLVKGLGRANLAVAGIDLSKDVIEAMADGDEVRAANHVASFLTAFAVGAVVTLGTGNFVLGALAGGAAASYLEGADGILAVLDLVVETPNGHQTFRLRGRF